MAKSSQQIFVEVAQALNSTKKKEKLDAIDNLATLLNQEKIIKDLSQCSLSSENIISWDILFTRVHNAALSLIDENSLKSRQMADKNLQTIQNIISLVIQKSLVEKITLINSNLLVSSILAVFESECRFKILGSIYLNIFCKYILPERRNWGQLNKEHWIEMKNLCKKYFKSPPPGTCCSVFLEILCDIIKKSSKNCQATTNFLDLFAFVKDIFISYKELRSNYEIPLLQLTNVLCLHLAIEFRYKVCEFTENIFELVISFHKKNDSQLNALIYHFLMTTLSVHNPNGVCGNDKSAYAFSLSAWKFQIKKIYFVCWDTVKMILKHSNTTEFEYELLNLFVDVTHMVFVYGFENFQELTDGDVSFGEPGPTNKRKCLSDTSFQTNGKSNSGKVKILKLDNHIENLVVNLQTTDSWFWLKFLELLICKYPHDLSSYKYCKILQVLCQLFCDKKDVMNMKALLRCLVRIIEVENSLALSHTDIQCFNDVWNTISSQLIRYLHLQASSEAHILLQALIKHYKIQDLGPLIKLFCNEGLLGNLDNFKTLSTICQYSILPEIIVSDSHLKGTDTCHENLRKYLLSWVLNGDEKYPCKDFAKLLVALILKKFHEEMEKNVDRENILITHTNINDFCKVITKNYSTVAFKNVKFIEDSRNGESNPSVRVDSKMKKILVDILKERWKRLLTSLTGTELDFDKQLTVLENCYWFCELLCHLLSNTETINASMINDNVLVDELKLLCRACTEKTLKLIKIKFFDLTALSNLFNVHFHAKVQKIIQEKNVIDLNLLQYLFELFAKYNESQTLNNALNIRKPSNIKSNSAFSQLVKNKKSVFHFQNLTDLEKVFVSAAEVLCQYVTLTDLSHSNFQKVLASKIIDILFSENVKTCSNFHLQMILRVIYSFTRFSGISALILNGCLKLISLILSEVYKEPELIITILQVLKDILPLVSRVGDDNTHLKYIKLMNEFRSVVIVKKCCGSKAVSKFIECIVEIFKQKEIWVILEKHDLYYAIFEDLLIFVKHPYHQVRLAAAQNLGLLFLTDKNMKKTALAWQKEMLKKLFVALRDNEDLYPKEKGCIKDYASRVLLSTSLLSLANVICLSRFWRKKAMFYLLHLVYLKNIERSKVEDIIQLICQELKISSHVDYFFHNFIYFNSKWAKKGLQIQDFPYYVHGCETLGDFVENHFPALIPIYLQVGRFDVIENILEILKKPISQILEKCLPMLLAFVLPNLGENVDSETSQKAVKVKQYLDEKLSSKLFIHCLTEHLDKFIFHMIRNMHDPAYLSKLCAFFGNMDDDKNTLFCTRMQIVETLENFGAKANESLLEKITLQVPSTTIKILVPLLENVYQAILYEDKVFAFYKYILFVDIISDVTNKGSRYYTINTFIIRDVVYSLLAIVRQDEAQTLTDMACECLKKIAESYLPEFSAIFGESLPAITTVLIPSVLNFNTKALDVLHFLICENYLKLEQNIILLDPFPAHEIFYEINQQISKTQVVLTSLKSIVKHFVKIGGSENSVCRIEGIKYLRKSLSNKKDELKKMYEDLIAVRGFSEDCKRSLLHQLICTLIELANNKNLTVRMEAAKCLGELGPSDLTTLVLKPENNFLISEQADFAVNILLKSSLNVLVHLLINDNFLIKKASSKALLAILSTRKGKDILRSHVKNQKSFECLLPFETDSNEDLKLKIKKDFFMNRMSDENLWKPNDHEKWIVNLVENLLQSFFDSKGVISAFRELIRVNWKFAEHLFPLIVDVIIYSDNTDCIRIIKNNFRIFFENNFNYKNKFHSFVNKRSVQCMLNIVDYIRMQRNQEGIFQESCLDVNYLDVAKAALHCSAFFTSIFYAELWFEQKRKGNYSYVDINSICELFPDEGFALTEILRICHSRIGNLDGIHGCGYMHILNPTSEIQHYEHIKNWNLSLLHHDIQLSMGNKDFEEGLINSLERSGMHYILNTLTKESSSLTSTSVIKSVQHKCAAELSDWSLLDSAYETMTNGFPECFDRSYYFALKAFKNEDDATFHNEIQRARKCVLNKLNNCSFESSKNLYLPLSELQSLKELEDFVLAIRRSDENNLRDLYRKWSEQDEIRCNDSKLIEAILLNRTIFLKIALSKMEQCEIKNDLQLILCQTYLNAVVAARKEKKYETAIRMLSYASNLNHIPQDILENLKIEKARIYWERGDKEIGRFVLSYFIKKNEITGELKAKGLRMYGDWMAKTKSENSREIIQKYYLKSIVQSNNSTHLIESYTSLAKFADSNYEQLNEYLSSPLFEIKQSLINTQQDLASELRQELGWNQNREKRMAYQIAAVQCAIDENEIKRSRLERDSYLCLALKYYLLSLKEGEKYNLLVFRIISMWMSNSNNQEVIQELKKMLPQIPTYKFLCLLPQLIPRMADVCLISDLVEQILQDHPHHTLPLLFALKNSYEDLKYTGNKTALSAPRVQAAKSILEKFKNDQRLEPFISEMENFSYALIELANYSHPEKCLPGCSIDFPDHLKIKQIKCYYTIPVPSLNIPYDKNCAYENIIGIHKFKNAFYHVGGINLPKRITCIGSDGIGRSLLVKGKDDLRQDAVMQQVFTIMNSLLSQNIETKKRKLIIRTYKVVPLSQRSGIIEWCENTQPLSLYLTGEDGKSGAHKTFYPQDISAYECRTMIRKVFAQPQATSDDKLKVFLEICNTFHPVFHYFFVEKFPAAGVWFERRLAYIHSVATSSMIGYVLGIGDRHVHNILIDNLTAEVIHIDLGIAFEQGKTLPIPETVPFRLTRDIVDGMGLSGVEGDFRISCIKTMEVLRDNQDTILTILEVLLYDPLYTWTITPEKAYSMQGQTQTSSTTTEKSSSDMETNKMAERALIRLKQKLQGTETGCVSTNVEGQVSYLVQQARDPNNLCKLFHGWQAYL